MSEGFLAGAGRSSEPGARAHALVAGGFVRARKDDPGEVVLYANQVGGFQVRCPACGTGLAREFRKQGDTVCPSCGGAFPIDALDCRPPVALGRASLVLCDVADAEVTAIPAGWHVILRRVR
ncbi:MAG: hypothetical protein R3F61_16955 [Myxococcota bacterium]